MALASDETTNSNCTLPPSSMEIHRLLEILRIESRIQGSPGFSHALHLNYERLAPHRFHFDNQTLTFRYCLSSQLSVARHEKVTSLATFMAVIHDVSTWALMAANPHSPQPGVSVSLQVESGPVRSLQAGTLVDIAATVSEIRHNLGFVQIEMKDICSGELICYGTHIKRLSRNLVTKALVSPCAWPILKLYARTLPEPLPSTFHLQDLFDSLDYQSHTRALFTATEAHSSGNNPMHCGCQAILLEMVGRQVAKHELAAPSVYVEMAQITFPSQRNAAKKLDVSATLLSFHPPFCSLRIILRRIDNGQIVSEGLFRFVNAFCDDYSSVSAYRRYDTELGSWDTPTTRRAKNLVIYSLERSF